jgi:phosphoglycolate phosphatase-like HAD superfamily hydrolase
VDALCARNAGVDFVWHRPGYGDPALIAALASAAFDSWQELLASSRTLA